MALHRSLLALVAFAQFAPAVLAQAPYSEKIEVSVVNVDVTVTDRQGKPVRGLSAGDFEVYEDDVCQPISNFYAVERTEAAAAPAVDNRFRRKVLVIVDMWSTTPFARNQAISHLEALVNDRFRAGEYDWSIGALDTELRVLLPPTSDKHEIHRALNAIRANHVPPLEWRESVAPRMTALEAFAAAREERIHSAAEANHADAILDAVRSFAATTGKKIVLLVSGQLLPNDRPITSFDEAEKQKLLTLTRDQIIREANASNVNVYIINPERIGAGNSSMYWIARETGGRLMAGNDIKESLAQFDAGSSNFYSLGYRPPHPADARYHRIKVRVKGRQYRLQYRDGYAGLTDDKQIDRTMRSPVGALMFTGTDLPVTLTFDRRNVEDGVIATIHATVPADHLVFVPSADGKTGHVEISISVFDASGRNVWFASYPRSAVLGKDEAANGTFVEHREVQLKTGLPYRVVVAVRDQVSDSVGAVQEVVQF